MSFEELNNIQIGNYYKNEKRYGGCISKDEVEKLRNNKFYILNMDRPTGPGTHWVILFLKRDTAIYFDSFGQPPPERISWFCRRFKNRMRNIGMIQSISSSSCGWYCLYVADRLIKGDSYLDIVETFDTRGTTKGMKNNEEVLKRYFL